MYGNERIMLITEFKIRPSITFFCLSEVYFRMLATLVIWFDN
jgi:hypothetical protein